MAAYTAAEVIAQARVILQDNNATVGYRKTDAQYLKHLNMGLAALSMVRPEIFETEAQFTAIVGPFQRLSIHTPAIDSLRFRGCDRNSQGSVMHRFEKAVLDRFNPAWGQGTTSLYSRQWCEHETISDAWWVYPPCTAGAVLYVRHVRPPDVITSGASTLQIPNSYFPVLVDYVVYVESSTDDENVSNQRAVAFFQQYLNEPGVASRLMPPGP